MYLQVAPLAMQTPIHFFPPSFFFIEQGLNSMTSYLEDNKNYTVLNFLN